MKHLRRLFRPPRVSTRLLVRLDGPGGIFGHGFTLNVSRLGCAIAFEQFVPVGTPVHVSFTLPAGHRADTRGVVCWCADGAGASSARVRMGIWITSSDVAFKHYIDGELAQTTMLPPLRRIAGNEPADDAPEQHTVLVVEDDADLRFTLADMLTERGYHVCTAINGREALTSLARIAPPAVILLDLMMPVMDGREFLRQLHEQPREPPVIIVSAADRDFPPASHLVKKPVDFEMLVSRIRECCSAGTRSIAVVDRH